MALPSPCGAVNCIPPRGDLAVCGDRVSTNPKPTGQHRGIGVRVHPFATPSDVHRYDSPEAATRDRGLVSKASARATGDTGAGLDPDGSGG
jgi:hypothetical protein